MTKQETILSKLASRRYVTDGGLETTLVFHHGMELPNFASFPLLETPKLLHHTHWIQGMKYQTWSRSWVNGQANG